MAEVVYRNLGELVQEAKKKYGFNKKKKRKYSVDHKKGSTFTTGFAEVFKIKSTNYKQGFTYQYRYYDDNGVQRNLSSVDFIKLRKKVLDKGLTWEINNKPKAYKTAKECKVKLSELM